MLVTALGRAMLVRLLQTENALSPIEVTPLGRVMLVRLLQKANAHEPILVTFSPILTDVRLAQLITYPLTAQAEYLILKAN